jgi:hypothetical protein
MTKKWIGINVLLLVIAAFAAWQLKESVQQQQKNNDLSKIQPAGSLSQKTAQETILPPPPMPENYNQLEFALIPEKNLFSESRTNEGSGDSPTVTGTMPDAQKPILVGVILAENQRVASIREPLRRGSSSQVQMKQIGDTYGGYTVTEIESDHIVLENGSQREMIYLNDSSQPASRAKTSVVSTRVIPIGGGTGAANTQTYVVLDRSGASRTVQMPVTSRAANAGATSGATGTQGDIIVVTPAGQPDAQQPTAGTIPTNYQQPATVLPATNPAAVQRGTRVIRTPIGDVIRNPQNR